MLLCIFFRKDQVIPHLTMYRTSWFEIEIFCSFSNINFSELVLLRLSDVCSAILTFHRIVNFSIKFQKQLKSNKKENNQNKFFCLRKVEFRQQCAHTSQWRTEFRYPL